MTATCPCGQPAAMLLVGARCPECGSTAPWAYMPHGICAKSAANDCPCFDCGATGVLLALEPLPATAWRAFVDDRDALAAPGEREEAQG